jgi:anti-sigma-K factor RskA
MADPSHAVPHPDLGGYVLGTLEVDERDAFEDHLRTCPHCRGEVDELSDLADALRAAAHADELPAGLADRTRAAVEAAATERETAVEEPAGDPTVVPLRRRPSAGLRLLAVAAAVLAFVVAAGLVVLARQRDVVAEFALAAPEGGPARGEARVFETDAGLEVELSVEGLEPTPPGAVLECWFVGPDDSPESPNRISVGTFRVDSSGRAEVQMSAAADLEQFPRMGVTLETDGGNPAQTGDKVLVTVED